MGQNLVTEICGILVSGIQAMASGIGQGLNSMAQALFVQTTGDTTTLSTFGAIVAVFGGIAQQTRHPHRHAETAS